MNRFSIKDLENLTGIKAHTIRIWEQRYRILEPKRTPTNIRYYDAEDLKTALRIALLNSFGYKISRIHAMKPEEMMSLISKIGDRDFRVQAFVNELLNDAVALDAIALEDKLNTYIRRHGIEETVEKIVFQLLEKIGIMWMVDRLVPAQEHVASNVITRKISVAIENLGPPAPNAGPEILLFLPEGEIHEIGLFYVYYLLRKSGALPLYLGANAPMREIGAVAEARKLNNFYVHLTATTSSFDVVKYLTRLRETVPNGEIWVSGAVLQHKKLPDLKGVTYLFSLAEAKTTFERLSTRQTAENSVLPSQRLDMTA